ncbi:transposase [Mycoplasmopsis mustelae]|uniref:Transposase n=1 Tax=Mycoplasmopsis mustelae TaxID=171289 RepID=A0A4R7UE92_9BACT|nr:IS1634 family transposase [Mycoplasmopsis mustelae]TDV23253.1 transposase [Mycoplasmopsis mustelae]
MESLKVFNVSGNKKGITYKYVGWYKGNGDRNFHRWFSLGLLSDLLQINPKANEILKTRIKAFSKNDDKEFIKQSLLDSLKETKTTKRINVNVGNHLIYDLLDKYKIFDYISDKKMHSKLKTVFYYLISRRITNPTSILQSFNDQEMYINRQIVSKNTFYRTLDFVTDNSDTLLNSLNDMVLENTDRDTSELFYDSSTVYFETFKRDGLKQPGYSKDGKFKEDQIVLGLACDKNGIPFHLKVFKGNTADSKTFIPFMVELQRKYNNGIKNLTVISDRGMSTTPNIRYLEQKGINYIISCRAKSSSQKFKNFVLDKNDYIQLNNDVMYKESLSYSTYKNKRQTTSIRRKIATFSKKRAIKDRNDRDALIDNFRKKQDEFGIVDSNKLVGSKKCKFFKEVSNLKFELDYKKINEDKKFDGLYVYETNLEDKTVAEIMGTYKRQWQIESNFRSLKTFLAIKPIYVRLEEHIIGHLLICFTSLVVLKYLIYIFRQFNKETGLVREYTEQKLIKLLNQISISQKVDIMTGEILESERNAIPKMDDAWDIFDDCRKTVRKSW